MGGSSSLSDGVLAAAYGKFASPQPSYTESARGRVSGYNENAVTGRLESSRENPAAAARPARRMWRMARVRFQQHTRVRNHLFAWVGLVAFAAIAFPRAAVALDANRALT